MSTQNSILIAGGYGVVGRQVATLIRQRHPDLQLIIQWIAELGVVVVDVHVPFRQPVFEGGRQIDLIADGARLRPKNAAARHGEYARTTPA